MTAPQIWTPPGEYWLLGANGKPYYPFEPTPDQVDIEMIAQSLSQEVRFGGHGRPYYSVAQHAILVSDILHAMNVWGHEHADPFHGLHHDDHEAYLVDLPSPIKNHPAIKEFWEGLEDQWDEVIFDVLGVVDEEEIREVRRKADKAAMRLEGHYIMPYEALPPEKVWPAWGSEQDEVIGIALEFEDHPALQRSWTWEEAEERFLDKHRELSLYV